MAAKGAIESAMERWLDENSKAGRRAAAFGVQGFAGEIAGAAREEVLNRENVDVAVIEKVKDVEKRKANVAALAQAQAVRLNEVIIEAPVNVDGEVLFVPQRRLLRSAYSNQALSSVIQDPVWLAALKNTLTHEQKTVHKREVDRRDAFKRSATVRKLISQLDAELLLSREQREQLTKIATKAMGQTADDTMTLRYFVGMFPKDKLSEILSQAQLATAKRIEEAARHRSTAIRRIWDVNGRPVPAVIERAAPAPPKEVPPPRIAPAKND